MKYSLNVSHVKLVTTDRSEGVLLECIRYSIKVTTRPGPPQPAPARPEIGHAFARLIIFFIYFCTE